MSPLTQLDFIEKKQKELVKVRDALLRLNNNKDFKTVIKQDYCIDEASRAVRVKGDINFTKEQRESMDVVITGIGALQNYFMEIERRGQEADQSLLDIAEERTKLVQEELENE